MAPLPGLNKGVFQDPSPPLVDSVLSPITIPNGTTLVTTKTTNETIANVDELIDYVSGDNGPNFIPQAAIDSLVADLAARELTANKGAISGYAGLDASQELLLANFPSGIALQVLRRNAGNTALEFFTLSDLQGITSINGDTTAAQILAGTTNRISLVDAGDTHTFDIDAAYVGQASITTLGTITTGVWNGTAITGANINAALADLSDVTAKTGTGTIVVMDTSPTIITPTIASFINATHNHQAAAGGGQLDSTLALSDTDDIAYLNTPNTYIAGNKQSFVADATTAAINLNAQLPSALVAGDIYRTAEVLHFIGTTATDYILVSNGQPTTYTAGVRQDFLGLLAGTAGLNVGGIAGNPTTQVDADLWLNTTTNQLFARINGVDVDLGAGGGGSQTPILQDVVYDGFDIQDLSNLEFRITTGAPATTIATMHADASGITINVPSGDTIDLTVAGESILNVASAGINFGTRNADNIGKISFVGAGESIGMEANDMIFDITTGDFFSFDIAGVPEYSFTATQLDLNNNNLFLGTGQITVTSGALGDLLKHDATGFSRFALGTNPGQFLRVNSAGTDLEYTDDIFTINFVIDGGGSTITTGIKGTITVDFNCEVIEWAVTADQSGDIVVDVNRSTFAGYPTTASIAGTELPTIITSTKGEDRTITSWSTIAAGDVLEFEVDSITTLQRATVSLVCRKTG